MTWFEDLYNRQVYLDLYAEADSEVARQEVDAILQFLEVSPGAAVLDVCCGYGRHALELARRGYRVVGIDLARRQIEAARKQSAAEGLNVEFILGDAREMTFAGTFQVTLNLFTSFGFFPSDREPAAMLARIFAATAPGGWFLMDFWNRERVLRHFQPELLESRPDGITVEKRWDFDSRKGRINWENRVHLPDGNVETWFQSIRAFTLYELAGMMEQVGFRVARVMGG